MSPRTSGQLLRAARLRAGLTQVALARRAGVAQSVISAYESGHRQPALPTLTALVNAAGFELDMRLRRRDPLSRLSGPIGQRVRKHRRALLAMAAEHGISNVRLFGSVARGEDRPDSDVDLMVDLPPGLGLVGLTRTTADLERLLDARVELVPADAVKPDVLARAAEDLIVL